MPLIEFLLLICLSIFVNPLSVTLVLGKGAMKPVPPVVLIGHEYEGGVHTDAGVNTPEGHPVKARLTGLTAIPFAWRAMMASTMLFCLLPVELVSGVPLVTIALPMRERKPS